MRFNKKDLLQADLDKTESNLNDLNHLIFEYSQKYLFNPCEMLQNYILQSQSLKWDHIQAEFALFI